MGKTKKFQAESKELLNLMINSIYSNKDVFLRELISNASDALDKRHFYSLQDDSYKYDELYIELVIDEEDKALTIKDNGIGMDEKDLEKNLGTIAKSGSKEFLEKLSEKDEKIDIIGQFGVGFYSSFIVANKVEIKTKKANTNGFLWKSDGIEKYTIEEIEKDDIGTEIKLYFKDIENNQEFLTQYKIQELVKNYSDYVKYPIYMEWKETRVEQDEKTKEDKEIEVVERKILNSQKAIWKKDKKDVTKEEYNEFYKAKFHDYTDPLSVIHTKAEGTINYELLLYIPSMKSFDYNSPNYQKGIELYSKGILIDHNIDYLLPDAFNFVKGLVDSEDLNLNISREILQQDAVVRKLTVAIEKKIQKELLNMQKKNREDYNKFFDEFGRTLIFGIYDNYGNKKDLVKDLVMYRSTKEKEYVTFKEYIARNSEQEEIYYVSGESIEKINQLPVMEKIKEKDLEVLYFLNDVDEFAIQVLDEYEGKKFKSITDASIDLNSEAEKEEIQKQGEENKTLLENMKEILKDDVSDVRLTNNLKDSAVCLVNGEGISLEMERILAQMPENVGAKANKILEINPNHQIFSALQKLAENKEELEKYSKLLYSQAMLVEGFSLKDPKSYGELVDELIIKAIK